MMKRKTIFLALIIMGMLLSACSGKQPASGDPVPAAGEQTGTDTGEADSGKTGEYSIDDLLGKWLCKENEQIITIGPAGTDIYSFDRTVSVMNIPTQISGNKLGLTGFSTYTMM